MRRFVPIIVITLFAFLSAIPLLTNQTTCSDDGFFHTAKAVTLEQMIRDGQPFGRWSPEMAHGFGYPYFNYYAPLPSYILIAIHSLGFIYPVALHIFFALCIWIAGLATYFFVRDWMNDAAGVAASVVYMTAPYFAFDILFRSALAESFALVFPPLILFFAHRSLSNFQLPTSNFQFWDLGFALSIAALLYTHNITALITLPLIVGYVVLHTLINRNPRALIFNSLIIILGLSLSARFWLPALTERNLVQSDKLLVPPIFTYYTNYLSLNELFASPTFIDPLIINPSPAKTLGLVTALLALIGFIAIIRHSHASRITHHAFGIWGLGFGIFFFIYSSLTLSFTQPLWDSIPLMPFIQFPWRLLGIASLCAAILSGAVVYWLPKRGWLLSGIVITVAALGNLSWWYPRYCSPFKEVTLADTIQYEFDTFTLGTSAKGEFLPNTVKNFPQDDSFGKAIIRGERLQPLTGLPPTAKLTITNPYPLNYRATITLPESTQLTFNQFYFPGWRATLDDQPLNIKPHPETGLINFTLPSGTHKLEINFGNTPIRNVADAITLIALVMVIAYCVFRIASRLSPISNPHSAFPIPHSPIPNLQSPAHPFILFIPFALILLRLFTPFTLSPFNGETISIGKPINAKLSSGLNVLSVEFPSSIESGSEFDVILYVAPREYTLIEYRPRFDLLTPDGFFAINGDEAWVPRWHREPPGTQYWGVGQYAQWARRIKIPNGTPPGDYQLRVNIFNRATLEPNSVVNDDGAFIAPYVSLGSIRVTRPSSPTFDLSMRIIAAHHFGPITLLGYNMDRDSARPGDDVYFSFLFQADQLPIINYQFNLFTPYYPFSEWQRGDIWRFQTKARIPADTGSAQYRFILKSPDSSYELAPIKVIPIQRTFSTPTIQNPTSIQFKDMIELAGYNINGNQIDLIWKALATPDQDLIAFVHVEDSSGKIIAQSDSVPANWSRPTTGWVKGEYIVDTRILPPLSNGGITLYVGFADRSSGDRFGDRAIIYKLP